MIVFAASTYVALVGLNGLLTGHLQVHPLFFVGEVYRSYMFQGASFGSWAGKVRLLAGIFAGHLMIFGALWSPAIAIAGARFQRLYTAERSGLATGGHSQFRTVFVLIVFTTCVTLFAVGMTTNFTAQIALLSPVERLRLHGRYYTFVFPLYLVIYFAFGAPDLSRRVGETWIRAGALAGGIASILLYYLQARRVIYPFDYPEAFVFSSWHGQTRGGAAGLAIVILTYGGAAIAAAAYAWLAWRGRRALAVYPLLLTMLFALSDAGVSAWQRANSVNNSGLRADAREMMQLIPATERDRGLVVGPEWNGPLAYFLFNFGSSAHVLVRGAGSALSAADLPPGTPWVLFIGPYAPTFDATVTATTPRVTLMKVGRQR